MDAQFTKFNDETKSSNLRNKNQQDALFYS